MESNRDNLIQEERQIAESVPKITTSGNSLRDFDIPKRVRGLTILDIGSGFSNTVIELQKKGANAIAVDYAYEDLNRLAQSNLKSAVTRAAAVASTGNQGLQIGPVTLKQENVVEDLLTTATTMAEFKRAQEQGDIKAVAAFAGHLPFADNSINMCLSDFAIDQLAEKSKDTLIGAVREALRVLKPGGNLQILPWVDNLDLPSTRMNKDALLEYLRKNNIPYLKENIIPEEFQAEIEKEGPPMFRLKIMKPGKNQPNSKKPSWINRLLKRV